MPVLPVIVAALIAAPIAFMAGWLFSKAYFRCAPAELVADTPVEDGRFSPSTGATGRVQALKGLLMKHEATRVASQRRLVGLKSNLAKKDEQVVTIESDLQKLRQSLSKKDRTIEQLRKRGGSMEPLSGRTESEMIVLRAERDEFLSQIQRLERRLQEIDAENPDGATDQSGTFAAELGKLRERLSQRDNEMGDLTRRLTVASRHEEALKEKLRSWNKRVQPLTDQFRKQRQMIRELRVQLKNGHNQQKQMPERVVKNRIVDDLEQICGIGPVLHRKLNDQGIFCYRQIADLSPGQMSSLAGKIAVGAKRMERDQWKRQAQQLYDQKYRLSA